MRIIRQIGWLIDDAAYCVWSDPRKVLAACLVALAVACLTFGWYGKAAGQ